MNVTIIDFESGDRVTIARHNDRYAHRTVGWGIDLILAVQRARKAERY